MASVDRWPLFGVSETTYAEFFIGRIKATRRCPCTQVWLYRPSRYMYTYLSYVRIREHGRADLHLLGRLVYFGSTIILCLCKLCDWFEEGNLWCVNLYWRPVFMLRWVGSTIILCLCKLCDWFGERNLSCVNLYWRPFSC